MQVVAVLALCFSCVLPAASEDVSFLKQEKSIPSMREWNREISTKNAGKVLIRVTGIMPFSVMLVTDAAYQALKSGKNARKEDILFLKDSKQKTFEELATLKRGNYWIIIENRSAEEGTFLLECFERK